MKSEYLTPATTVVEMEQEDIICASGLDVIAPDDPNKPAGTRGLEWDEWGD